MKSRNRLMAVYRFVAKRSRFRERRMADFRKLYHPGSETRVVDVGGFSSIWQSLPEKPRFVMVNLDGPNPEDDRSWWVIADGCHLPFADGEFDIAYSNSVIEHVGDLGRQKEFAKEIARIAKRFYVQTPNYWFPVEPHFLTPLIHFLPKAIQHRLAKNFTLWGIISRPTRDECRAFVDEIRLLTRKSLRTMFPKGHILSERALGLTKSWIVIGEKK